MRRTSIIYVTIEAWLTEIVSAAPAYRTVCNPVFAEDAEKGISSIATGGKVGRWTQMRCPRARVSGFDP
jgi:hypothetical protein